MEGWTHLDPILLAALTTAEPMLLIGRHGTAKSFLLERLAEALGLKYRFYNASLVNYDDLVGIPVPTEDQRALRYISTPTSIWDAEVVFVDELNRTKPELQNKLFPIIHERRVQGVALEKLRYRWAAMNPAPLDDADDDAVVYLGAEPLDPALADRFAFLIEVPSWENMTPDEKRTVLLDQFGGRHDFPVSIPNLISRSIGIYAELYKNCPKELSDYIIALVDLLNKSQKVISTRRATMLLRNILAIQAARVTLAEAADSAANLLQVDWDTSAFLAILHGHPALATLGHLDRVTILAAHKQAWKIAGIEANDPWKRLLQIHDPVERLALALQLGRALPVNDLSQLISDTVASEKNAARRTALSLAIYLAIKDRVDLPAGVVEILAKDARRVLMPVTKNVNADHAVLDVAREIGRICSTIKDAPERREAYTRNLLQGLLPDGYVGIKPEAVMKYFHALWARLVVEGHNPAPSLPVSDPV
ncbi:MAG: MoxR family ATPase [bacterium]